MTTFRNHCPHLDSVGEITKEDLIQKSHGACQDCKVRGPNLWACLEDRCSYVGCGESQDHSTIHSKVSMELLDAWQWLVLVLDPGLGICQACTASLKYRFEGKENQVTGIQVVTGVCDLL